MMEAVGASETSTWLHDATSQNTLNFNLWNVGQLLQDYMAVSHKAVFILVAVRTWSSTLEIIFNLVEGIRVNVVS